MAVTEHPLITIGVLALQGAFSEHIQLLRQAIDYLRTRGRPGVIEPEWQVIEVRTPQELEKCDALVIPGGESTTISLVAERSGLLEPLREFVKVQRRPTWGTCAGLILLAESANRTKRGGQELIGGLDVRVNRNHFGRQVESFQVDLQLPFLSSEESGFADPDSTKPFRTIFIRAPVVERVFEHAENGTEEQKQPASPQTEQILAPSKPISKEVPKSLFPGEVEVMARLPNAAKYRSTDASAVMSHKDDIIAVRQGNVFGTSFHPELTSDPRIHAWWLRQVLRGLESRRGL